MPTICFQTNKINKVSVDSFSHYAMMQVLLLNYLHGIYLHGISPTLVFSSFFNFHYFLLLCNLVYYVICGAPVLRMRGALVSTLI